jgi:hypothetical protein
MIKLMRGLVAGALVDFPRPPPYHVDPHLKTVCIDASGARNVFF